MSGEKPREIAARVLQRQTRAGADYVEHALDQELATADLAPLDRNLARELVYGVVRWRTTLDWLIARKSRQPNQKPMLQNLLRLGLYQIFWLDRIPNHAAVHETVESAKRAGCGPQSGFINAMLRGYLREYDTTRAALDELKTHQPHLGYSHPEWLVQRWLERWGQSQTAQLLDWNNTPAETYARVNTLKTDATRLIEQWREEDVEYDFVRRDWLDENLVFKLSSHPALTQLASFQQGWFYVQDPSTLMAVKELDPRPGENILDFCSAPGGKTTYIAQLIGNNGRVSAQDIAPDRLDLVQENCARLGVTCVDTILPARLAGGSTTSAEAVTGPAFDRILIDAPCSNTGVMRRRVDSRWRLRPADIGKLGSVQGQLLAQCAPLLKPGGTLVYSTCSLEPEENQDVIGEFLKAHGNFELARQRELVPFRDGVDGAFVAILKCAPWRPPSLEQSS